MLARTDAVATSATSHATKARIWSNHAILPKSSATIWAIGQAKVRRLPCLLYISSRARPAMGVFSFTSTALMSLAVLGSWPFMFWMPSSGIQITRSAGVFEASMMPVTT